MITTKAKQVNGNVLSFQEARRIPNKMVGVAAMDETVNRAVTTGNHEPNPEACKQPFNLHPGNLHPRHLYLP